jgi:anti-sigma B factor antagonist
MLLRIETLQEGDGIVVVELAGKITAGQSCQLLEAQIKDLLARNQKKLILDLSRVDYIDSMGLGAVAYGYAKVMRAGGGMRVAGAGGRVRELMKTTRLDAVLSFYPTVAAAAQNFRVTARPGEQSQW